MENSPTEQVAAPVASTEPTTEQQPVASAEQIQETNPVAQPTVSVSDDTAAKQTQTQETQGGEAKTDDGLAKFAESQGFNFEELTDDTKRALKIAHDNQKAFRERGNSAKIVEATSGLTDNATEARIAALEQREATSAFFADGTKDAALATRMGEILTQKKEQYGKEYAAVLSKDLDLLYAMASTQGQAQAPVDVEAIRREERESINRQMAASTAAPHASQGMSAPTPKVTQEWIDKEYDPRNPEHIKLVDEFYSQK